MSVPEQRKAVREATFQLADMRVAGDDVAYRVKVRNLSNFGMMGEGRVKVVPGSRVVVDLHAIGAIHGGVAWVQQDRFGIAFDEEIDVSATLRA
jgi:hypothetical protein